MSDRKFKTKQERDAYALGLHDAATRLRDWVEQGTGSRFHPLAVELERKASTADLGSAVTNAR